MNCIIDIRYIVKWLYKSAIFAIKPRYNLDNKKFQNLFIIRSTAIASFIPIIKYK